MSVSYEVYSLVDKRWQIHARYDEDGREQAIAEAKQLDREPHVRATCVVRETYDPIENLARESIVHYSAGLKRPPSLSTLAADKAAGPAAPVKTKVVGKASAKPAARPASRPAAQPKAPRNPAARRARSSAAMRRSANVVLDAIPRIALLFMICVLCAILFAYIVLLVLNNLDTLGLHISLATGQTIMTGAFVVGFLALFLPLLKRALRPRRSRKAQPEPPPVTTAPMRLPEPVLPVAPPPEDAAPTLSHDEILAFLAGEEERRRQEQEARQAASAAQATLDQMPVEAHAAPPATASAAQLNAQLLQFMGHALSPVASSGQALDAYNRFGVTLFLAGAGDHLAAQLGLPRREAVEVLTERAQSLGHTEAMARGFCANMEEYLLQPRYLAMYDAGRSAMMGYVGSGSTDIPLGPAIEVWNRPADYDETANKDFVAVLFTDIVGSTRLGQEFGDARGMEVVRDHNRVVREALTMHGGKEVKHTGDGIMAVFSVVASAVEAAIRMQTDMARFNAAQPDKAFQICIGINAGEPIREGGDFFGTPVQLAARVLAVAEAGEIAVSSIVRDLCAGKSFDFEPLGDFELKGFKEPVSIYKVRLGG
ncbi:MAG: adenylate/guanylate cyclase domain-containing protein [Alphaproteobacteria bacterium]